MNEFAQHRVKFAAHRFASLVFFLAQAKSRATWVNTADQRKHFHHTIEFGRSYGVQLRAALAAAAGLEMFDPDCTSAATEALDVIAARTPAAALCELIAASRFALPKFICDLWQPAITMAQQAIAHEAITRLRNRSITVSKL